MIKVGDTLPEITFSLRENGEGTNPTTADLFTNKKVVLFAVPGAFTPTCSNTHWRVFKRFICHCSHLFEI
mgnify:CR=1 FL=1